LEETLGSEDTLILYTDGVVSARHAGELFGEARLLSTFVSLQQREVQAIAQGILQQASEFAGGYLGDDVAIVVVRRSKAD
jgi:serine phosphatase RsbU (regulator of sigma subunit)